MSGYWSRFFVAFALAVFVVPLFAADKNFTDYNEHTYYETCERLLDANLSGYFVATDVTHNRSQFISLSRLGATSAYIVASAKMDMPAQGIRELSFSRQSSGWLIGDPYSPERRVNVLSLERFDGTVHFKFNDVADVNHYTVQGVPHEDINLISGADILSPDGWILNMQSPYEAQYRFTRVRQDRIFEQVVGQALKGQLADRSESGQMGFGDNIIIVDTRMPLNLEEASRLLGTDLIYPIEDRPGSNDPTYRFAVPKNLYTLLEAISRWTRSGQVAHIDAIPAHMLNPTLVQRIVRSIAAQERDSGRPPAHSGSGPANLQSLEAAITGETPPGQEPTTSAALEALNRIGGSAQITSFDPKSLQPKANQQHPRNLDEHQDDDEHDGNHRGQ